VKTLGPRLAHLVAFAEAAGQRLRLFCQDESRFGLHLPSRRRLTSRGVKPHQEQAPLYEYYWLYGAVEPKTGEAFFLEMPCLDSLCFEVFLREMAQAYAEDLCVVVLDGAPAHVAHRLQVPANVVLVFLPAYSPELNPVERLWEDLKGHLDVWDAQIRSSVETLREHVAERVRSYTAEALASLTGYRYLVEVASAL
jgi:hypothetical protein